MAFFADIRKGSRLYPAVGVALVALAFGLFAWFGITLTRDASRIAAFWLPNALLLAVILRQDWPRAAPYMVACHLANIAVGFAVGDAPLTAVGLAICNSVEVGIVYYTVRRVVGRRPDLSDFRTLGWFSFAGGIFAPAVSASLATGVLVLSGSEDFLANWMSWAAADALGMLIGAPVILVLFRSLRGEFALDSRKFVEWVAVLGIGTLGTALVFAQSHYPFLFMASLFVLFAAFRLGMTGAAAANLIVALIATVATSMDSGPVHLVTGDIQTKAFVLQVFLLFTFAGALPVAAALATRDRLRTELAESRDLTRSIFENMQDVVFRTDEHGCWTFLNPAWEDLTGYTVKEAIGWRTTRLLHEEDFAETREIYPRFIAGEMDEMTLHQRFQRADGAIRHIEVSVTAIRSPEGAFLGSSGSIRDVTEAREAQQALADSEKRFQTLANLSPAGIFRTALNGDCTYVNQAWLDFAGLAEQEAMGSGWARAIHPDDVEWLSENWRNAVERAGTFKAEFRFKRPDGSVTSVMAVAAPEVDDHGKVSGHIGVVIDISDVVAARRALEEERGRFEYLAENATDAIISMSLDGTCLYASQALYDLTGYKPEEVIGKQVEIPIAEEGLALLQEAYAKLATGEIDRTKLAYHVQHKTRGWRWHESNVRLVRDPDTGEPMETIASVRDVTDRKEMEDQLRKARDAAEAAAQAKASFLANMSHEIRTPMNGVTGFADLLLETELDSQQRQYVELIAESGRSMVTLINDILDLSKIEAGQMAVEADAIDIQHTVGGTLRLMRAAAHKKGLSLDAVFREGTETAIIGDKLRIRQILSNLVGNAIKFTEQGGISVVASVEDGCEGPMLHLAVSDTGIGIEQDRLAAIFDEFVQADGSTVRKFGGTGLGLAISRRLASLMGGSLSVTSEIGEGSTFTLCIPFVATSKTSRGIEEADENRRKSASGEQDDRKILVVEDHEINRLLVTALIDKAGYRHSVAGDGLEAIEMIEEATADGTPFNLVLMDVQMPGLDGIEATRRIRASGNTGDQLPIVALTANAYRTDVEECLEAGMQDHLAKPVRMGELGRIFDTWLPKRRSEDAPDEDDETVKALRPRYDAFKREALAQLEKCFQSLPDPTPDELDELKRLMHKLAGSAAIFGDEELGTLAGQLEDAIEAVEQAVADRGIGDIIDSARKTMIN